MAHQLATRPPVYPSFRVLGMIFIDSVPFRRGQKLSEEDKKGPTAKVVKTPEELDAMKLKEKVNLNMTHARVMVLDWDMPRWDGTLVAPPTVLLRAREPTSEQSQAFVDRRRHDRLLGWQDYNEENGRFIRDSIDIEGHHFSIFKEEYVSARPMPAPVWK